MPINGVHALLYSSEPEELRRVLADVIGWDHVNDGGGWLIFRLPPTELGVHPGDTGEHSLSLMCDDIEDTVAELRAKGIEVQGEPVDEGWGIVTTIVLPGGVELGLYEPRHQTLV